MIEALISSKTRIKILLKFFLNSRNTSYLRGLEQEFGESTNSIRLELNRLEGAGLLKSYSEGNKKYFQANMAHPLYDEIHNIVRKYIGLDRIVENVVERLGDVRYVYLTGDFAKGLNGEIIDLVFVGDIDKAYLMQLVEKAESIVNRRVRYIIYEDNATFLNSWNAQKKDPFLIWSSQNLQAE